jgi:uncharacterized surface anchored protein
MRRVFSTVLALVLLLGSQHLLMAAGAKQQNIGEIAGTAVVEGKPLNNITVRLRNVDNGRLVGDMRTNELGQFRFTGLPVGNYVVETVAPNGTMLGTSTRISLVAGALVATGVTVTTSAAAAAAVGVGGAAGAAGAAGGAGAAGAGAAGAGAAGAGAAGAGAAAAGAGAAGAAAGAAAAGGAFLATTAGIVTAVAVGAGVTAAVVAVTNDASASGG